METKTLSKVIEELARIQHHVGELLNIYEGCPELNDEISISKIIPMSLDDWRISLGVKIEELCKLNFSLREAEIAKAKKKITELEESYHGPEERRYAQLQR